MRERGAGKGGGSLGSSQGPRTLRAMVEGYSDKQRWEGKHFGEDCVNKGQSEVVGA